MIKPSQLFGSATNNTQVLEGQSDIVALEPSEQRASEEVNSLQIAAKKSVEPKKRDFFIYNVELKEKFHDRFVFRKLFQKRIREILKKSNLKVLQCKFNKSGANIRAKCKPTCICKASCKCDSKCKCVFTSVYDFPSDSIEFRILETYH